MLKLTGRETALDELDQIVAYIGERDFDAGVRMHGLIQAFAERLVEHPFMYRSGRLPETRDAVVHPNYVLIYRVGSDNVEIVSVLHSRREYPPNE